jgi:hypothetical protein
MRREGLSGCFAEKIAVFAAFIIASQISAALSPV